MQRQEHTRRRTRTPRAVQAACRGDGEMATARVAALALAGFLTGCADVAHLRYGQFLMSQGRTEEAYPYLRSAAAIAPSEATDRALAECASRWSAELAALAGRARARGDLEQALTLLLEARRVWPRPAVLAPLTEVDATLRALHDGREEYETHAARGVWRDAIGVAERLLRAAPHDAAQHARLVHARVQHIAAVETQAQELLDAGAFEAAAAVLEDVRRALGPGSPHGVPAPDDALRLASPALVALKDAAAPEFPVCVMGPARVRGVPRFVLQAEMIQRAIDAEVLLRRIDAALAAERVLEAFALLARARVCTPGAADLPARLVRAGDRIAAAAEAAMHAAFIAGDLGVLMRIYGRLNTGIPSLPAETLRTYGERLRELTARTVRDHLAAGRGGNALLVLGAARDSFPGLWLEQHPRARHVLQERLPFIDVRGEGADDLRRRLNAMGVPTGAGERVLRIDLGPPALEIEEMPPSSGFEEREVPGALTARSHPLRDVLEAELALAHGNASRPSESADPWEAEAWRAQTRFWTQRYTALRDRLDRVPRRAYRFEFRREQVRVEYRQLRTRLSQPLVMTSLEASRVENRVVSANRSFTRRVVPGDDPLARGRFPSRAAILAERENALRYAQAALIRERFDEALAQLLEKAVRLATEGRREQAIELLCRIWLSQPEGAAARDGAEKLLAHAWEGAAAAGLAAPAAGIASRSLAPKP